MTMRNENNNSYNGRREINYQARAGGDEPSEEMIIQAHSEMFSRSSDLIRVVVPEAMERIQI